MADNFCKPNYSVSFNKRKLAEAETEERIVDSGSGNASSANELWMSASGDAGVGTEVDDGINDDDVAFQSVPTGEHHSEEVDDFFVTVPKPDNSLRDYAR